MCEDLEDCDFSMGEQGMGVPEPGIGTKKKKSKSITGTPISTETAKVMCIRMLWNALLCNVIY